jgi:vacuolar-type H+-ATPase subunit I/STV1
MDADLIRRVEHLEETVESLRDLPDRTAKLEARMGAVETQIVQLRAEMRDEFSAIRKDMVTKEDLKTEVAALRAEIATKEDLRTEVAVLRAEMATKADLQLVRLEFREDIAGLGRDFATRLLESEGRTRVLIEDVIARIAAGREGSPPAN